MSLGFPAHAHLITVDPGFYAGNWNIDNTPPLSGIATVNVATGIDHVMAVGVFAFKFDVDSFGNVSVQTPAAATGGPLSLTFSTTPITIDPGAYSGQLGIQLATSLFSGPSTFDLVPGVKYGLQVAAFGTTNFDVDAAGNLTNLSNPDVGIAAGNTLTLNTAPITIDPSDFAGSLTLTLATAPPTQFSGPATFDLVVSAKYNLQTGGLGGSGAVNFDVEASGNIANPTIPDAVMIDGNTLTLQTTQISIDPGGYTGPWSLASASGTLTGAQTLALILATSYGIFADPDPGFFGIFLVGSPCSVDPSELSLGGTTFSLSCNTAVTVEIDLKPGSNPSTVNLGSQGVTPLAVFGSADFDATQTDILSLEINGQGANVAVKGKGKVLISFEDLNNDGFLDANIKFDTEGLALEDDAPLVLTGTLLDSTPFTGEQPANDPVNIVP